MSHSYRLRLEQSTLVFFPPQTRDGWDLHESWVVQVMMKLELQERCVSSIYALVAMHMGFNASNVPGRYPTREEVAAFYDAQEEITAAVETILIENLIMPLQKTIEIDGDGYVLVAEKKEWAYGQRLSLKWGDEEVRACADKWVFYFHPCRRQLPSSSY
ncbi:hypothetical protein B0H13DRAFT_2436507 [Mycena leptocephala]|nr:hypothetical protein B0H13DRAFT_2436507 [Mycena leptocephala]